MDVSSRLALNFPVTASSSPFVSIVAKMMEGDRAFEERNWATSTKKLQVLDEGAILLSSKEPGHHSVLVRFPDDNVLMAIGLGSGHVVAHVAAPHGFDLTTLWKTLEEQYPRVIPEQNEVPVEFWTKTKQGPRSYQRRMTVEPWEIIEGNYHGPTKEQLSQMMHDFQPGVGGKLLLWSGIPGTGKTFALRALASEWRAWCYMHYITDPEEFFGDSSYLMEVLLSETWDERGDDDKRWRLLIFEDVGELLRVDAKEHTGQGLQRLLNSADGLIGQGLRILILATTNEDIGKLHKAISRPGRCAVDLRFGELSKDEATQWLQERNIDAPIKGATTLATLFAMEEGRRTEDLPAVGF